MVSRTPNGAGFSGPMAVLLQLIRPGEDRREKLIYLTDAGAAKLHEACPAWERVQERLRSRLPKRTWSGLLDLLPELTRLAETA